MKWDSGALEIEGKIINKMETTGNLGQLKKNYRGIKHVSDNYPDNNKMRRPSVLGFVLLLQLFLCNSHGPFSLAEKEETFSLFYLWRNLSEYFP